MENIASDLKISELKQDSLCKAYEALHSEASSILMLTLQWKDLEDHFNLTRKSIQEKVEELDERERRVGAREKELEAIDSQLRLKIELKGKHLDEIEKCIEEQGKVLESIRQEVGFFESSIQGKRQELEITVKQYHATKKLMAELERDFDQLQKAKKERSRRLDSLERSIKQRSEEAESKGKELDLVRGELRKCRNDLDVKERQVRSIRRSVEEHRKEEQLRVRRSSFHESDEEIKLREEKLSWIQDSIVECSIELELKENLLELVRKDEELKTKNFTSLKKSLDQYAYEFDMKERQFEGLIEKLEVNQTSFESKIEELGLIHKKVIECLEETESNEKNVVSLQRMVEERSHELETRENQFEERVNEFSLRQKEFYSIKKSTDLGVTEKTDTHQSDHNHNKANFLLFASYQYRITNGQYLQLLLSEQLKTLYTELFTVLQESQDPAKLVLDAVQGSFALHSSMGASESDASIGRRVFFILLEQLMKAAPDISSQVREKAIKLARDWKAKMMVTAENYFEVLGFLQFLASYRLASAFDADELRSLFDVAGQNERVSKLRRVLCIADEEPVSIERAENSRANIATNSPNFQFTSTTSGTSSDWFIHENLTQNDILAALQMPDPAKSVLDITEGSFSQLWKRGDDVGFEAVVLVSYVSMFEQLLRISPRIELHVREDAMKLAVKWKAKMKANTENSLELLGFLQFLTIYELVSSFDEDEILRFLEMISQNKQALELSRTLGSAYKIPLFIRNLIQRKKFVEAVRLTYVFELTEKCSPIKLLIEYMENAKSCTRQVCERNKSTEEKDEATEKEIAALKTVVECIKDYDLESQLPSSNILKRIALLEKIKKDRRDSALFFQAMDEQEQQQTSKKRKKSILEYPGEKPRRPSKMKSLRKALSPAKPRDSPAPKPVKQQTISSTDHLLGTALANATNPL